MKSGNYIAGFLAGAALAMYLLTASPCAAQKNGFHPPQRRAQAPAPPRPQSAKPEGEVSRPETEHPLQRGHVGDWLRQYKDLPPQEQERALQNDPFFQRLPPARQQILRQRLQHFSNLPPQQQLRMLNRMDTWEHLTPDQKQQARQIFQQMRDLTPDRRRQVMTAVRDLRTMPPDQREEVINSPRFKSNFSDQERDMIRGVTRLPLSPAEGNEPPPQD